MSIIKNQKKDWFLRSQIANACTNEKTYIQIAQESLKKAIIFIWQNYQKICLVKPIEKDPLWQAIHKINLEEVKKYSSKKRTKFNFRIFTGFGSEDTLLYRCTECKSFLTNSYSTQLCVHFINEEIPKY